MIGMKMIGMKVGLPPNWPTDSYESICLVNSSDNHFLAPMFLPTSLTTTVLNVMTFERYTGPGSSNHSTTVARGLA